MRTMTLALSISLFGFGFAACGDNNNNIQLPDLSGRDMASVQPDLAPRLNGCRGLSACLQNADTQADEDACLDGATPEAAQLYDDIFGNAGCIVTTCTGNMDADAGGMASCNFMAGGDYIGCNSSQPCTGGRTCNSQGFCAPTGVCDACITRAFASGGGCAAATTACNASRP